MFITILTLGIAGVLAEFAEVVRHVERKDRDRLFIGWTLLLLFAYFTLFWHTADITLVEDWDFGLFLFAETGPVLLLLATQIMLGALAADPEPSQANSFRQERFFVIFALVRDLPGGNDSCQKAIELSGNVTDLAYDTSKATFDGIEGDDRCIDTPNLWYRYTATETGNVTVTLEGDNYSVDPKLAIYDGTDCPPTMDDLIGCNDDFDVDSMGWASQITFWAIEGRQYLIEVASRVADEAGPGTMTIRVD